MFSINFENSLVIHQNGSTKYERQTYIKLLSSFEPMLYKLDGYELKVVLYIAFRLGFQNEAEIKIKEMGTVLGISSTKMTNILKRLAAGGNDDKGNQIEGLNIVNLNRNKDFCGFKFNDYAFVGSESPWANRENPSPKTQSSSRQAGFTPSGIHANTRDDQAPIIPPIRGILNEPVSHTRDNNISKKINNNNNYNYKKESKQNNSVVVVPQFELTQEQESILDGYIKVKLEQNAITTSISGYMKSVKTAILEKKTNFLELEKEIEFHKNKKMSEEQKALQQKQQLELELQEKEEITKQKTKRDYLENQEIEQIKNTEIPQEELLYYRKKAVGFFVNLFGSPKVVEEKIKGSPTFSNQFDYTMKKFYLDQSLVTSETAPPSAGEVFKAEKHR